jgi:cytochrome oxidase Cu insertion factor (SCO1/SenC/PrrC family)
MRSAVVAAVHALVVAAAALPAAAVGPGDSAPDFTLQDAGGASYTLSAYQGKVVLLALIGYG